MEKTTRFAYDMGRYTGHIEDTLFDPFRPDQGVPTQIKAWLTSQNPQIAHAFLDGYIQEKRERVFDGKPRINGQYDNQHAPEQIIIALSHRRDLHVQAEEKNAAASIDDELLKYGNEVNRFHTAHKLGHPIDIRFATEAYLASNAEGVFNARIQLARDILKSRTEYLGGGPIKCALRLANSQMLPEYKAEHNVQELITQLEEELENQGRRTPSWQPS